jgi:dolichol-phosphate mannosyltransferase
MKVLIIIPTYNEKENIKEIIEAVFRVDSRYHILVVDDDSPDKTAAIVKKLQRKYPNLNLIEREFREGLGPAYISGFNFAFKKNAPNFDYIIQMDADFSHDPQMIPALISLADNKHFVVASRYINGGKIKGWDFKRLVLSWLGNTYTKVILGFQIKDWTSGFCCWPKKILTKINPKDADFPDGYAFQVAIKYRALKAGFKPIEVPIIFKERRKGKSKMGVGIINEAGITILRLKLNKNT